MLFIILFSILVLVVINIFYRILINQDEVLAIKDRIKDLEDESKGYKNDTQKTKEYFSKIMDENRKLTKLSFKPMLISFAIVMIMLPVLSFFYTDYVVSLDASNAGNVTLGSFYLVKLDNNTVQLMQNDTEKLSCELPCTKTMDDKYFKLSKETIEIDGKKTEQIRFSRIIAMSPVAIPYIGRELGWIWIYILMSIPMTIVIKKLMGVKI